MNISNKIIMGFSVLAITILIVGAGGIFGIGGINKQLHIISDESVPQLTGSYQQTLALNQANQSLLKFLNSRPENFQTHLNAFDLHFADFTQALDQLKSQQIEGSPLFVALSESGAAANYYLKAAKEVQTIHGERTLLTRKVITETQMFQAQIDSMSNWGQRYLTTGPNEEALDSIRTLLRTVNKVKTTVRIYQKTLDIEKLKKSLIGLRAKVIENFNSFKKADKEAARIEGIVEGLKSSLEENIGLLGAYIKQDNIRKLINSKLKDADTQLAHAETALEKVLETALNNTDQARTQANLTIKTSQIIIYSLSAAGLIMALFVGWVILNTIRQPLNSMREQLAAVGQGDLTIRFNDQRPDEFGELAVSLNTVVTGLQEILQQMITNSKQLSQMAEDNAKTSQETTSAMTDQSEQLELTSAAATEMENTVAEVSHHANSTLSAVQHCEELSLDVDQKMELTRTSITSQAVTIEQAVHASTELEQDSKKIDTILITINTIAEQTNLLALNAAIEAARAGDQGRGFAVVADEVRQLASRTQNSTEEIQAMVGSMQMRIRSVATGMRNSHNQAGECVDYAQSSSEALNAMQESIQTIRNMNTQIAEAASQQNTAVQEVSRTLVSIHHSATETALGANMAAESSATLLKIVEINRGLIRRFTI
ncbi:methyl-accepting chemotaxis protein [Neptunomonas antarctica]|uniref:Methyl-accepting chemotaxis protein n=1 Tax=Neptunomonas antarctica TaxID=619304 RepID=A0A1N7J2R2_9GAMM|nr:methyl-accepting chemotaxis protein [Neptunomonas antarctica]SIS43655.1 Methyl-accepting chemotaxis protein [Neptunomonas antarctica]